MKRWLLGVSALAMVAVACSAAPESEEEEGASEAISVKNLGRQDFGLEDKELILTLDDGPGARTKELVDYFVEKQVPAVFFMVGNNAKSNESAMQYVASRSHEVEGGLIVGNHSLTHTTPLPKQGVDGTVNEIVTTDGIIGDAIKTSQSQFDRPISFFRPPYGAFTSLGGDKIAQVNARGGAKYVGPIFWEIGGELTDKYSADWACWGKVSIERCRQGYVAEAQLKKKGIILVHDVHSKTVDMLTGRNGANGVSLIDELRGLGFKFVGLRSHPEAIARFSDAHSSEASRTGEILATASRSQDGTVEVVFDIAPTGATKGVVQFDNDERNRVFVNGAGGSAKRKLAPGQHKITIAALAADGRTVLKLKEVAVVVPADLTDGAGATTNDHAPCVNYSKLTLRRPFKLFIKKVDCSAANAVTAVPGECYAYNGTLRVAATNEGRAAVRATGGAEWSVEYDLTFAADANDVSKLSLILETGTGKIITGKRHAYKNGRGQAVNRADVPFTQTAVDCNEGIWRGTFNYANGSKEDFLFRKPNSSEPEYNER